MADIQINVDPGTQTRLLTAGKYCKDDILITASGGGDDAALADSILDGSISGVLKSDIKTICSYALYNRTNVTKVYLPKCTYFDQYSLQRCSSLVYVYAPAVKTLSNYCLGACNKLKYLDLPSLQSIGYQAFLNAIAIVALILRSQVICKLSDVNNFKGTPIASGTGYIYVPDELVEQYKVATNWATYAEQIKPLSEIPEEVQEWLSSQNP